MLMKAEELKSSLKRMNMSYADLADILEIRSETVWRWVKGKSEIKGPAARAIKSIIDDFEKSIGV